MYVNTGSLWAQPKECLGVYNAVKVVDDFSSLIKTNSMGKMYE